MRLLLDTCIVYDWLMGEIKDAKLEALIRTEDAFVSPISVWEMAIKHRLGKLTLPTKEVESSITGQDFAWLFPCRRLTHRRFSRCRSFIATLSICY